MKTEEKLTSTGIPVLPAHVWHAAGHPWHAPSAWYRQGQPSSAAVTPFSKKSLVNKGSSVKGYTVNYTRPGPPGAGHTRTHTQATTVFTVLHVHVHAANERTQDTHTARYGGARTRARESL